METITTGAPPSDRTSINSTEAATPSRPASIRLLSPRVRQTTSTTGRTAHARVLVFDSAQVLRFSLGGGAELLGECGAVSALCFNPDCTRLLVGFAKGQLAEFDVANTGKLLQRLDDAHPIGAAVTHARFTDDPSIALVSDSGGSVFEIVFRKRLPGGVMKGFTSRCVFSGSRGEVCAFEPLSPSLANQQGHFLSGRNIVAMATISKVLVLTLRPSTRVLFSAPLSAAGASDTLPVLSWQFVVVKTSSRDKVVDPVLAFGRHKTLFFYQVTQSLNDKPNFVPLQRLDLDYSILTMAWLNTRCMAIVDVGEVFHLHDVKNQVSGREYSSSFSY